MNTERSRRVEQLRFITAGSVDDGKSTLIGRLLYDSKSLFDDQVQAVEDGSLEVNLANVTDGLRAEREQGITIDVAYRYFATPRRRFVIADVPGHVQYTRNMVTAASTANCAVLLIDARRGVVEQTRRHACIASLLGIPKVVICINKMDLVEFSQEKFEKIQADYRELANGLGLEEVYCIPVSGLLGDNVVERSENMPWYKGLPLLDYLETLEINHDRNLERPRLFVQWVIRVDNEDVRDFRGYAGEISSGVFTPGQAVTVLPSGMNTRIRDVTYNGVEQEEVFAPMSVIVRLEDEVDVSRGDCIVASSDFPYVTSTPKAHLCWMSPRPLGRGKRFLLKHGTRTLKAAIQSIDAVIDITSYEAVTEPQELALNDIGRVSLKLAEQLAYDAYEENRYTGGFILIDEGTHETVAAGMLLPQSYPAQNLEYSDYVI